MANIKLTGNTWDTSGIYDAAQQKTQAAVNADVSELKTALDGIIGGNEVITNFETSNLSTWAGMGKGVVILNAPIINKSGKVLLTCYNHSTHPSFAASPFVFILYQRTSIGTFTVKGTKSVDPPASVGTFSVETDWNVTNDGIYYVGMWRKASSYIQYIQDTNYRTFYKTSVYNSSSDITVNSTLDVSGFSISNSNAVFLNITIAPDNNYVEIIPPKKRLIHFSVDDCVFWADLISNSESYTSVFQNPQLSRWKFLHDIFGICVTMNCFNSDGTNSIENVPTKFADELKKNAHWLKFAFHAQDASTYYDTDKVDTIVASYDTFVDAVIAMAGTPDSIDTVVRLGFYSGTINNVLAIRDADCGITGLVTSDDTRNSYYLNETQNAYILNHNWFLDADNHLAIIHSMPRMESVTNRLLTLPTYLGKDFENKNRIIEIFTHENLVNDNMVNSIDDYCVWALLNHMKFGYASNLWIS